MLEHGDRDAPLAELVRDRARRARRAPRFADRRSPALQAAWRLAEPFELAHVGHVHCVGAAQSEAGEGGHGVRPEDAVADEPAVALEVS